MRIRRLISHLLRILLTVFLAGLLSVSLVRLAPGFGVDERELDPRLGTESIEKLRRSHAGDSNVLIFYFHYLRGALRGDLGTSRSLNRPVSQLLAERLPVTLKSVAVGLAGGWLLALALALAVVLQRQPMVDSLAGLLSGGALSLPSAVVALLFLFAGWPPGLALAAVVFPRVFRYVRNLLLEIYDRPHVLLARAKGLSRARILVWHLLPPAGPQLLALAGVSVSLAFGAAIPIEVVCDSPGIGQLAWQAALSRDLPLLINITVLVTLLTLFANFLADLALPDLALPQTQEQSS